MQSSNKAKQKISEQKKYAKPKYVQEQGIPATNNN